MIQRQPHVQEKIWEHGLEVSPLMRDASREGSNQDASKMDLAEVAYVAVAV